LKPHLVVLSTMNESDNHLCSGTPPEGLPLSKDEKRLLDKTPDADREARLQALLMEYHAVTEQTAERTDENTRTPLALQQARLALDIAGLHLDLDNKASAYTFARNVVPIFIEHQAFEDAAMACQYVYLAEHDDSIAAVGQAAWLSVTYPVDPHLTANILNHIIDETPDDSDGGAVAAATAHYVVDIRVNNAQREELKLFTGANLARVAKRHSRVQSQTEFELWVERLELDIPEKLLVRLRNVIDVMVQDDWWFDRDQLQNQIPD